MHTPAVGASSRWCDEGRRRCCHTFSSGGCFYNLGAGLRPPCSHMCDIVSNAHGAVKIGAFLRLPDRGCTKEPH